MVLNFSEPGKVAVSMVEYIKNILDDRPNDMMGTAFTPATEKLYEVNDNSTKLPTKQAELFCHITAQ